MMNRARDHAGKDTAAKSQPGMGPARTAGVPRPQRGVGGRTQAVPDSVYQALSGPGSALDAGTRALMEARFGRDFGAVRVHTGPAAASSAKAVNARAYTLGQHIAFDDGEYRPGQRDGRLLLAHELAHTIQQLGCTPSRDGATLDAGGGDPLEREAHQAALDAMRGTRPRLRPGVGGNQLSRASRDDTGERDWNSDLLTPKLAGAGVLQVSNKFKQKTTGQTAQAFDVGNFDLPGQKGDDARVLNMWSERVASGALESTITGGEPDKLLLKQERPETESLRKIWITRLGTDEDTLIDAWNAKVKTPKDKEGPLKDKFIPVIPGAKTAHMDHIVELQLGGNNSPENLQVLDASENTESGREIYNALKARARAIKEALGRATPHKIVVHYSKITPGAHTFAPRSAFKIAREIEASPPKSTQDDVAQWEDFVITAGGSTSLKLPPGVKTDRKLKPVALRGTDAVAYNVAASTLIPGMLLDVFTPGKKMAHKIGAKFDNTPGSKSRIPFDPVAEAAPAFAVGKDEAHKLTLDKKSATVAFYYPYLSEGRIKTIDLRPDGIAGTATLTPSIKLIKQLDLEFAPNHLAVITKIDKKKIDPGIAGLRIKDAELLLDLFPDFKPSGRVSFELGPQKRPFADGFIEARRGADGFEAEGKLYAHVPSLDEAEATVLYKKLADGTYGWSAALDLKTSKIPRTRNVAVHAELGPAGWTVSGSLTIGLPGKDEENEAVLTVKKEGDDWLFTGDAIYKPPIRALDPVQLHLAYNISRDKLSGWGKTGFRYKGLEGSITLNYEDGATWGEGTAKFEKGKASGSLQVKLSRAHKISGEGTLTYQVTPALIATGKVTIDENQEVLVEGLLEYKGVIPVFPPVKGDKNLLTFEQNIPVPGLSVGGVGVQLKLVAALDAGFTIKAGELHNVKVGGKIKPLDPNPDPTLFAHADFICGAEAHITGSLGAGIALSILVAEVAGGLSVSATAQLAASIKTPVDLKYEQQKFTADVGFEAKLALAIILGLKAWVLARAGIGPFSVSTRWDWTLASYTYRPAFAQATLTLKKPLHYSSDGGIALPSWDDFDFKGPQLDPSDVVGSLFRNADPNSKEV
jgi:hypothetical protein